MKLLSDKINFAIYIAGGGVLSKKPFDAIMLNLLEECPHFFLDDGINLDACWWGPISSIIDRALNDNVRAKMQYKQYWASENEPITPLWYMNYDDISEYSKLLDSPYLLKKLGIDDEKLKEIVADSLVFCLLPKAVSVAFSFCVQHVKYYDKFRKDRRNIPKDIRLEIYPSKTDIKEVLSIYKDYFPEIVIKDYTIEREASTTRYYIPYKILLTREEIDEKFNYLRMNFGFYNKLCKKYEKKKDKFLDYLIELTPIKFLKALRKDVIDSLKNKFSDLSALVHNRATNLISELHKNFDKIEKEGYYKVIYNVIGGLAEFSVEVFDNDNYKENICAGIEVSQVTGTRFFTHFPERIIREFKRFAKLEKGTWNYGLVHHLESFIQLEPILLYVYSRKGVKLIEIMKSH